jgi:hypothetical protein
LTTWPWAAIRLMPLLRSAFDGPDLARAWLHYARPYALSGRTPLEALNDGDEADVRALLEYLLRGA